MSSLPAAEALALDSLVGAFTLTIGGKPIHTTPPTVTLMPAHVPHAVLATEPSRMLLIMLRTALAA